MKRFCLHPGCSALVDHGRCPTHHRAVRIIEGRFTAGADDRASYDLGRPLPPARYGSRWRRAAHRFLAVHPFCIDCVASGNPYGLATEVDHRIPHRGDRALFWDERNWDPRCRPHHSAKTARETLSHVR